MSAGKGHVGHKNTDFPTSKKQFDTTHVGTNGTKFGTNKPNSAEGQPTAKCRTPKPFPANENPIRHRTNRALIFLVICFPVRPLAKKLLLLCLHQARVAHYRAPPQKHFPRHPLCGPCCEITSAPFFGGGVRVATQYLPDGGMANQILCRNTNWPTRAEPPLRRARRRSRRFQTSRPFHVTAPNLA